MRFTSTTASFALALSPLVLAACGGNGGGMASPDGGGGQEVTVQFAAQVGDEEAACGETYAGLGTSNSDFTLNDFRMYIHDVELVTSDGEARPVTLDDSRWQRDGTVLLDFEDGSASCDSGNEDTNGRVQGTVPEGDYTGIRFKFGVPKAINHGNASTAEAPMNLTSLFWSWNAGYKFIRLDGTTPALEGWRVHIGSTECTGEAAMGEEVECGNPNRAQIELDGFDPASDEIVADLAMLFEGADLESNAMDTQPGCMSKLQDTDCKPYFHNLGLPWDGEESPGANFYRVQ